MMMGLLFVAATNHQHVTGYLCFWMKMVWNVWTWTERCHVIFVRENWTCFSQVLWMSFLALILVLEA